jgi:hypothetical protein
MTESKNMSPICETQGASGSQAEGRGVESLNSNCFCISLDADALKREFETDSEMHSVYPLIVEKCPHLFAAMPVFVSRRHLDRMAAIVRAAQTVIALPAYREIVLGWAPLAARCSMPLWRARSGLAARRSQA